MDEEQLILMRGEWDGNYDRMENGACNLFGRVEKASTWLVHMVFLSLFLYTLCVIV